MTPAPTPLPPEEIERLKATYAWVPVSPSGRLRYDIAIRSTKGAAELALDVYVPILGRDSSASWRKDGWRVVRVRLEAEIEAGRAGAERVPDIRVKDLEAKVLETIMYVRRHTPNHSAKALTAAVVRAVVAALRQAAQPADGGQDLTAEADRLHGHEGTWRTDPPAAPAQVGVQPSELERLRHEVASLRASLGQPADRPAEPIGCPAPGACSCPSAQPAPDMVQRHEKQLAAWLDAHPVFGPAHRAYESSKAAQPAGRVEPETKLFISEMNRLLDAKGSGGCPGIPAPAGWDRECVKCAFKWRHVDWGALCPVCEGDATPPTAGAGDDQENGK